MDEPHYDDARRFARAFAARWIADGFSLWRVSYALMTMHPEVLWRTVQWRADAPDAVVVRDQPHARLDDEFYTKSAVAVVRRSRAPVRVALGPGDLPYPICEDLRSAGGTDYLVQPLAFTNNQVGYVSFASNDRGGFSDADLAAFEALAPFFARRIELESAYYATRALLDVYLGKNAARRVSAGAFQRGKGELIDAAIWFSDMRDFTALTDGAPPAQVIEILDAYFDAVASAVADHGGEVLKFIGDAVLAIFPIEGNRLDREGTPASDARAACRQALEAADQAFAALAHMNDTRARNGEDPVAIGVALHRGKVMYGNIGARERLDFTVISSSVNEASRLESLCKVLRTPLALSAAFAEAAEAVDLVDLGEHELKGVKAKLRVFTPRSFSRA